MTGRPTKICSGCHSEITLAIFSKRVATGVAATTHRGRAPPVSLLPMARPMRRSPKSKASQTAWSDGLRARSGVPNGSGKVEGVDAQHSKGCAKPVFGGCVKEQRGLRDGHVKPCIGGQF